MLSRRPLVPPRPFHDCCAVVFARNLLQLFSSSRATLLLLHEIRERILWHVPIRTKLVCRSWQARRAVPLDEVFVDAALFIAPQEFAVLAHRSALGHAHPGSMAWRISRFSHRVLLLVQDFGSSLLLQCHGAILFH